MELPLKRFKCPLIKDQDQSDAEIRGGIFKTVNHLNSIVPP